MVNMWGYPCIFSWDISMGMAIDNSTNITTVIIIIIIIIIITINIGI